METRNVQSDCEKRAMEEKAKERTRDITLFLKGQGFQPFTSDGTHFFDADEREYADHGLVHPFTGIDGRRLETGLGDIHPEKDLFNLLYTPASRDYYVDTPADIRFLGNRTPSSQEYGGFFLFDGVSWYIHAIDGSFRQAIHPVLMLRNHIKPSTF